MTDILYIALTVIALLSLWDSYVMQTIKEGVRGWVSNTGRPSLTYFFDCHYCKGFWMCVIGASIAGNLWLTFPAYGIVVIGLSLQGEHDE